MQIKIELPGDVFDAQFREADFRERVRELAILELVRVKRLHEHEAKQMLGVTRWQLVERMKAAGIAPTEEVFGNIREELTRAIGSRRIRANDGQPRK
jgi:phage head maturation protease